MSATHNNNIIVTRPPVHTIAPYNGRSVGVEYPMDCVHGQRLVVLVILLHLALILARGRSWKAAGLTALPFLSAGFFIPNADLLWKRLRPRRGEPEAASSGP